MGGAALGRKGEIVGDRDLDASHRNTALTLIEIDAMGVGGVTANEEVTVQFLDVTGISLGRRRPSTTRA